MQIRRTHKPALRTDSKKGQAKWQPTSVDDMTGQIGKEHWSRLRALRVIKTLGPVVHTIFKHSCQGLPYRAPCIAPLVVSCCPTYGTLPGSSVSNTCL